MRKDRTRVKDLQVCNTGKIRMPFIRGSISGDGQDAALPAIGLRTRTLASSPRSPLPAIRGA